MCIRDRTIVGRGLKKSDAGERPDPDECLADDVRARNGPPHATVARIRVVVAHHEVLIRLQGNGRDGPTERFGVGPRLIQCMPRLIQREIFQVDRVALGLQRIDVYKRQLL